jgi:hypothetical protein
MSTVAFGYGFDLDSTLTMPFSPTPYPEVIPLLAELKARPVTTIFVATNQAGPVYRRMLGARKYPSEAELAYQLVTAADALGLFDVPWFIATWHGNSRIYAGNGDVNAAWARASGEACVQLGYEISRLNPEMVTHIHGSPHWRKPEWGMLETACNMLKIPFGGLVYVGDMETDRQAARDYGAAYIDAAAWRSGGSTR